MKEFEIIYEQLFHRIYQYIYTLSQDHSLAEDITQETLMKAYEHMIVHGKTLNKSWFYTVARNQFITYMRKKKYQYVTDRDEIVDALLENIPDNSNLPEDNVLMKEMNDQIKSVLLKLSESYRSALILREYHGLSFDDIADIVGVKKTYAKQLVYRAREKFKIVYGGMYHD